MPILIPSTTAIAPGKIILAGEHAAVADCPALGMAINRFATATLTSSTQADVLINLTNYRQIADFTFDSLHKTAHDIEARYHAYLKQQLPLKAVLKEPFHLPIYTLAKGLNALENSPTPICLTLNADIPIGYGLGSSAAMIVSVLFAVNHYFSANWDENKIFQLALQCENLQHGKSSGLDIHCAIKGYSASLSNELATSSALHYFNFINTGLPESTTGECVERSQQQFHAFPSLKNDFTNVVEKLKTAFQANDHAIIQECVKRNHQLLCQVGVVPVKVQQFIAELEKNNMTGKICGAGSIRGDAAGVVTVVGHHDISDLLAKYNYQKFDLKVTPHGARIL